MAFENWKSAGLHGDDGKNRAIVTTAKRTFIRALSRACYPLSGGAEPCGLTT
jgi:hypothetical protein